MMEEQFYGLSLQMIIHVDVLMFNAGDGYDDDDDGFCMHSIKYIYHYNKKVIMKITLYDYTV